MASRTYYSEEARKRAKRTRALIASLALAAGAGIGTILTLLFSPMDGDEARGKLENAIEDSRDKLDDQVDRIQAMAS